MKQVGTDLNTKMNLELNIKHREKREKKEKCRIRINHRFSKIYILFLAALGLHCCARAFSSCGERGLLFVVVCGLLIAVASLAAEHGL